MITLDENWGFFNQLNYNKKAIGVDTNLVYNLIQNEAKGLTGQSINLCAGLSCG